MTAEQERASGAAPQPVLTVAAVARRLGVAPSTLRTWDRRYGLGPSAHTAGSHRRYGPDDVHRLGVMRSLTLEGVPPAEAAQIALGPAAADPTQRDRALVVPLAPRGVGRDPGADADAEPDAAPDPGPDRSLLPGHRGPVDRSGLTRFPEPISMPFPGAFPGTPAGPSLGPTVRPLAGATSEPGRGAAVWITQEPLPGAHPAVPAVDALDQALAPARSPTPIRPDPALGAQALLGPVAGLGRAGGGRVLPMPDASPRTRGLARAAMALDTFELQRLLRDAIAAYGVVGAWESMVVPVLTGLGERWRVTGEGIDVEHAFCEAVAGALRGVTLTLQRPRNAIPVLLACAEDDSHSLPLHVVAAALAEEGVGCRMLGVGLPAPALVSAVRRTGPAVVLLYARLPVRDCAVLRALPRQRPAPRVLVGGPGWDGVALPAAAVRVSSLTEALLAVRTAARL
jgi:MerR family transcriptional regulator, light-induced transcriptional regulator